MNYCKSLSALIFFTSCSANAALFSRLGGMAVYNDTMNITWLADANLAASNSFGLDYIADYSENEGEVTWAEANNFIAAMNADSYLGFSNWRLPTADISCIETSCSGNEIGHLYYNELNISLVEMGGDSSYDTSDPNYALFSNVQRQYQLSNLSDDGLNNLLFNFFGDNGGEAFFGCIDCETSFAWAVADGDVFGATVVPVPAAVWLFGSGIVGLAGIARRRS